MKKIISIILIISLFTITFTGCNNDSTNSQSTIRKFITALYTVTQSDYNYYQKMENEAKDSKLADFDKIYETNSEKFHIYLTDKSYNNFYASRFSYLRIMKAFKSNVFVEIKDLKISKINEDKKAKTLGYRYELQLNQINRDTKKSEIIKMVSYLTVINENGNWKIVDGISL